MIISDDLRRAHLSIDKMNIEIRAEVELLWAKEN